MSVVTTYSEMRAFCAIDVERVVACWGLTRLSQRKRMGGRLSAG
jgi:hypothetical protein